MKYDQKDGITVEQLLRLKRLERPPVEFWAQFEKELRAKQLAAIVQRRPWWKEALASIASLSRYQVPVGATAALALAFLTIREYRSSDALVPEVRSPVVVSHALAAPSHDEEADLPESAAEVTTVSAPAATAVVASAPVERHAASVSAPTTLVPILVGSLGGNDSQLSPSARSIEVNLAAARAAEPDVVRRLMNPVQAFEARMLPAKAILNEPIARLDPAAAERRERLLGTALPTSATVNPALTNGDRLARNLSDDRLYEQISRYSAVGDRLSLKF
jgi:hypothetical protein